MRKLGTVLVACALLSACATIPPALVKTLSCDTYNATLTTLAGYRAAHKLSASEIATVEQWRPTINALCGRTSTDTSKSALDQIEAALLALNGIKGAHQ